jgi:hypothetical protein
MGWRARACAREIDRRNRVWVEWKHTFKQWLQPFFFLTFISILYQNFHVASIWSRAVEAF